MSISSADLLRFGNIAGREVHLNMMMEMAGIRRID